MSALLGPLIYVAKDLQQVAVRRRGRYTLERDAAASPRHLQAAIREAEAKMVAGLGQMGYRHTGAAFTFNGIEEHLEFGTAGVQADAEAPDLRACGGNMERYLDEMSAWEKAEKARAARRAGMDEELVDFTLSSTFVRRVPDGPARADGQIGRHRVHIPEAR